jgi:hypothetical protein
MMFAMLVAIRIATIMVENVTAMAEIASACYSRKINEGK